MIQNESTRALQNLGLSEHEAQTYVALLKLGTAHASVLAKETGVKRTTIYPILKGLAERGIVNVYVKHGRRTYAGARPELIARAFTRKLQQFESLIPTFPTREKTNTEQSGIRYLEGKKEIIAFYESTLDEYAAMPKKQRHYRVISAQKTWEGIDPAFFIQFRYERGKRCIHTKLLLTAESRVTNPRDPTLLRDCRFLPEGYVFQDSIDIHSDKVLVMSHQNAVAVVITIPTLVSAFQVIFDILWGLSEK